MFAHSRNFFPFPWELTFFLVYVNVSLLLDKKKQNAFINSEVNADLVDSSSSIFHLEELNETK